MRSEGGAGHLIKVGEDFQSGLLGEMRGQGAHQAILHGHTACFTLGSDMLHDLAAQDSTTALARRLCRYTSYTSPTVLAIDEVGYLSYDDSLSPL